MPEKIYETLKEQFKKAWEEARQKGFGQAGIFVVERLQSLWDKRKEYWIVMVDINKIESFAEKHGVHPKDVWSILHYILVVEHGFDFGWTTIILK